MPLKALKKVFGDHPQTRLKRFKSLLCNADAVLICFNKAGGSFNDPFAIRVDETLVVAQTCKTSYDGISLCVFRCANETVKRVVSFCRCHDVVLYIHCPFRRLTS